MINLIISFLGIVILIFLFTWIKNKVTKNFLKIADKTLTNCSIGKVYSKDGKEIFSWTKFKDGMFNIVSSVQWSKSIKEMIDLRKALIYTLIATSIFAFAWYQGRTGAPVKVDLGHGKEAYIRLNGNFLHIDGNGLLFIEDKLGNKIKQIAVKDIPNLKKKLSPIGLELKPSVLGCVSDCFVPLTYISIPPPVPHTKVTIIQCPVSKPSLEIALSVVPASNIEK